MFIRLRSIEKQCMNWCMENCKCSPIGKIVYAFTDHYDCISLFHAYIYLPKMWFKSKICYIKKKKNENAYRNTSHDIPPSSFIMLCLVYEIQFSFESRLSESLLVMTNWIMLGCKYCWQIQNFIMIAVCMLCIKYMST